MATGNKAAVVILSSAAVIGLGTGIYFATRTSASGGGGGGGGGITHPQFQVNDIIQKLTGSPSDNYYQMKITQYVAGGAPNYGSYVTLLLSGPLQGGIAIFWVKDIDGYYQKIS